MRVIKGGHGEKTHMAALECSGTVVSRHTNLQKPRRKETPLGFGRRERNERESARGRKKRMEESEDKYPKSPTLEEEAGNRSSTGRKGVKPEKKTIKKE